MTLVGVQLQPQHCSIDDLRTAWKAADEAGLDSIWTWDHFFPLHGDPEGDHFEGWSLLAAMAADTTQAKLGLLVSCNSYRNPEMAADMTRTIDHISGGRVYFGIGSGWFERDYEEYGYEFGTAGGRLDILEDALPVLKSRLSSLNPPAPGPMPILIGGGGEKKTLRYVARHAQIWHSFYNPDEPDLFTHKSAVLANWCEKEGTDNSKIERSVGVDWPNIDDLPALFSKFEELGIDEVTLGAGGPDYDFGPIGEFLTWRDSVNG